MTETSTERPRPRPYPRPPADDEPARLAAPESAGPMAKPAVPAAEPPVKPPVKPSVEPTLRQRSRVRTVVIVAAAAVVVLGFVAANIWLFTVRSSNDATETARPDALAAARTRIPAMLSYSYKDITTYAAAAPTNTTGAFKKDFTQLVTAVIAPAAKQQHITTKATVKSAGIIDAHQSSVVVLVMIDQTTTSDSAKGGRIDGSRVRVVMTKSGGTWLVGDMTPV